MSDRPQPACAPRTRRFEPWLVATLVVGLGAFGLLLYLDHTLTFWLDEWSYIRIGGIGTVTDWLRPHNEHWSTLPFLLYEGTFSLVRLNSYLPYIAELLVIHVVAVAGVVVLVRRDLGPIAGFAVALPLVLIGSGYQNIEWAFQTGFVGSVAGGVWALVALDMPGRRSTIAASLLLLASLMCSSIGLFWLVAVTVQLILDRAHRGRLWAIVPAVASYIVWYVAYGAAGTEADRQALTIRSLIELPRFVGIGLGHAVGAFTGLGNILGAAAFVALALLSLAGLVARSAPPRAIAMVVGLVAMFVTIAIARTHLGLDFATRSRYVYVAGFFLVLAVSSWLRTLEDSRRMPGIARLALVAFAGACLVSNVVRLPAAHAEFQMNADLTRAFVTAARQHESEPSFDPKASILGAVSARDVVALTTRFGDPNVDTLIPGAANIPTAEADELALIIVLGRGFRAGLAAAPMRPAVATITDLHRASVTVARDCLSAVGLAPGGYVTVLVPPGGSLTVTPAAAGEVGAWIGRMFAPTARTRITVPLTPGSTTAIKVPDTGNADWQVHLELPPSQTQVCVASPGG